MDSEEEGIYDDVDSGNESSGDDDFAMEVESNHNRERQNDAEDYPFEVLSTEQIVQHMVDCIREVNLVVEVSDRGYRRYILVSQTFVNISYLYLYLDSLYLLITKLIHLSYTITIVIVLFKANTLICVRLSIAVLYNSVQKSCYE